MNAATNVTAVFLLSPHFTLATSTSNLLAIKKSGSGTVSSNPPGINSGSVCLASFSNGSYVSLTVRRMRMEFFGGLRRGSLENLFDPNHREKSPRADRLGSSSGKWLPRIELAVGAPSPSSNPMPNLCQ
jgi:hypothetical protein